MQAHSIIVISLWSGDYIIEERFKTGRSNDVVNISVKKLSNKNGFPQKWFASKTVAKMDYLKSYVV